MGDESELLRAILDRMPAQSSDRWTSLVRKPELKPDTSQPLRDALADWLAACGRWPGEQEGGRVGGCSHDYPEVIRVADLRLRDQPFRVLRCALCDGRLWAYRISDEMFSKHFIHWPLPSSEEEIKELVAGSQSTVRLISRSNGASDGTVS